MLRLKATLLQSLGELPAGSTVSVVIRFCMEKRAGQWNHYTVVRLSAEGWTGHTTAELPAFQSEDKADYALQTFMRRYLGNQQCIETILDWEREQAQAKIPSN